MMIVTLPFGRHASINDQGIICNYEKLSLKFKILAFEFTKFFITLVSAKVFQRLEFQIFTAEKFYTKALFDSDHCKLKLNLYLASFSTVGLQIK